mgnify:CR=1 FL=1
MTNPKPHTICAIDASTNSLAFAFYTYKKLTQYGKINFEGSNIYEKVQDATAKTKALFNHYNIINAIVIEHTVFMNSPKTAADLTLVQGAIISSFGSWGIKTVGKVSPITWQNYIGNKRLTKDEQLLVRSQNPGKSQAWYKGYERGIRKQRTIKFININYDKNIDDNDVADACGIGHWALNNWDKAVDK